MNYEEHRDTGYRSKGRNEAYLDCGRDLRGVSSSNFDGRRTRCGRRVDGAGEPKVARRRKDSRSRVAHTHEGEEVNGGAIEVKGGTPLCVLILATSRGVKGRRVKRGGTVTFE